MSLTKTAIKRPVTVWMAILTVVLFGMVGFGRLPITLLPEMNYPSLTVRTLYPGAAPAEVEQLVAKPIEESVGTVKGLRTMTSTSRAGLADLQLEFAWGTDMDLAALDVREKLDAIELPLDVEKPLILRFNPNLDPIMRLGLISPGSDNQQLISLRSWADDELKRQLEVVEGVASVRPAGGLVRELQILLDQHKLAQLSLTPADIVNRIGAENINLSAGKLEQGNQQLLVRTLNQFESLEQLANIIIFRDANRQLRLKEVAEVIDGYAEQTDISRVDGQAAVEIAIYKEGDANAVTVANAVRAKLDKLAERPGNPEITVLYDQSGFIATAVAEVTNAALIGALLAMAVILLFLRKLRPTLIICLTIPVSVIATFNLMYFAGLSLNLMSLGGIALAVGLLVDNAIVVLENIDRQHSHDPAQAAQRGTVEVASAITASTLTTLAVFVPLLFVDGVAGALFGDQALTVTFALLASLLTALTAIPMLAARPKWQWPTLPTKPVKTVPIGKAAKVKHYAGTVASFPFVLLFNWLPSLLFAALLWLVSFLRKLAQWLFTPIDWGFQRLMKWLSAYYPTLLMAALQQRSLTLLLALVFTAGSFSLLPKIGMELVPSLNQGEFYLEVQLPPGSHVGQTDAVLDQLAQAVLPLDGVAHAYSQAGSASQMASASSRSGENWGRLQVVLDDPQAQTAVMAALRQQAARIPDLQAELKQPQLLSFKQPLAIELYGYDLTLLKQASELVAQTLANASAFSDVSNSLRAGQPELTIRFDHARLAALGMDAPQVAEQIATLVGGSLASRYTLADRKIDIRVRAQAQQRDDLADIGALIINPGSARPIALSAVADIEQAVGPAAITRIDQQRVAVISSGVANGSLSDAVAEARRLLAPLPLPAGITVEFAGQNQEMEQSNQSLTIALLLAVFLVYIVMASQFESFVQPLLILISIPMALAGSVLGLYLSGNPLSVLALIGLIMLCGIVVNNAIVLVDRVNQHRHSGMDRHRAIVEAGRTRLRPILMTTITTILGLLPMLVGFGGGAELRAPLAVTVIAGLGIATLLTLVVLPVLLASVGSNSTSKPSAEVAHD
ncbi:efflux RND transporter permease subunit [Ferrimonas senticii]|uniref:efflux RND transporter permease subunit n=1 Tax=Ferrimonas senticii TaxID=394566 RepID=UPI0003FE8ABB|nr:efflux RND transporter permease subunit [Ferrimonas senticii]